MQANYVQRLRLIFSKMGPTRFIGHLDLARTMERSLNRARIPVAYTQGYNQRPRMQFAAALPLGYTSECELADIWLTEIMGPDQLKERLMAKIAPGLAIIEVTDIPLSKPNLQTMTAAANYSVTFLDQVNLADLQRHITNLLAADSHIRIREHGRNRKAYDLRPLILGLSLYETTEGTVQLSMHLMLKEGRTGRPDELLRALELDPLAARIHRTALILDDLATI